MTNRADTAVLAWETDKRVYFSCGLAAEKIKPVEEPGK